MCGSLCSAQAGHGVVKSVTALLQPCLKSGLQHRTNKNFIMESWNPRKFLWKELETEINWRSSGLIPQAWQFKKFDG